MVYTGSTGGYRAALKAQQSALSTPQRREGDLGHPATMAAATLSPGDANDFRNAQFAGPAIDTVTRPGADGQQIKQRALVGRFVHTLTGADGDAVATYDSYHTMATALKYREDGQQIAQALCDFHADKVFRQQKSAAPIPGDRRRIASAAIDNARTPVAAQPKAANLWAALNNA